jgi:AcrR family transcriptional regulator
MATPPVKRPTGREEILDAVLDAAERLFAEAGPGEVSLRAIATEAGVNYGLVHRHFGTKDALFDRLLRRYEERWTAQLGARPDYDRALDTLLGPAPDVGAYLRLLAWTMLSGDDEAQVRHSRLDRLPTLRTPDGADPIIETATALATIFGWRFFGPFIRATLHLDDDEAAALHEELRSKLIARARVDH